MVKVVEVRRSRQLTSSDSPTARLEYAVFGGPEDPELAELYALAAAPPIVAGLPMQSVNVRARDDDETVFDIEIQYGKTQKREPPETGDEEISFDLSPQTTRVSQSLETIARVPSNAPNFNGGIGFKKDEFEGADVFVPALSFSITRYVPTAQVTNAYIQGLMTAAFRVNDAPWRGHAAGEVLFAGASGAKRSAADYTMTFRFMASKNATQLQVGNLVVPSKTGWDYLWVLYDFDEDQVSKAVVKRPKAAYVERVYEKISFPTYLGIAP